VYGLDDRLAVERVHGRERRAPRQIGWRIPLRDDDLATFGQKPRRGRASNRAVAENGDSVGHGQAFIQSSAVASPFTQNAMKSTKTSAR